MSGAYYNEFDPFAAAWLRERIKCGFIPEGDVDEKPANPFAGGGLSFGEFSSKRRPHLIFEV